VKKISNKRLMKEAIKQLW
jgi:hypothetical protein